MLERAGKYCVFVFFIPQKVSIKWFFVKILTIEIVKLYPVSLIRNENTGFELIHMYNLPLSLFVIFIL